MQIHIKKNHQTADGRTRKILNKNGDMYEILKYGHEHSYERRYEILVKSVKTNWQGWLKIDHINFEQLQETLKS
jgi:hypothetical protein